MTDYLISRKLACAKGLLEGGADVTEACFASGFHDISYFIKKIQRADGRDAAFLPQKYWKYAMKY